MWRKTYSKVYKGVKKEDIWRIWIDVTNWPLWHGDLDFCILEGTFKVGNHFMLKPTGAPAVKVHLLEVEEGVKFTDCTKFFGGKMHNTHEITETNDGLMLTNTLIVTGPLRYLWIKLVAQKVANSVPQEMDALVNLSRKNNG